MRRLQKEYYKLKDGLILGRLRTKEKEVDKLMDELYEVGQESIQMGLFDLPIK